MVEQILSIAGYVLSAVAVVLSIIFKASQIRAEANFDKATALEGVFNEVASTVAEAEKIFGNGNGYAKLSWALSKLQMTALKLGLQIDDETLKAKIEDVLSAPQKKEQTNG